MCKGILIKKNYTKVSRFCFCPNEQDWKDFDTEQDLITMIETEKDGTRPNETKQDQARPNETEQNRIRPNETKWNPTRPNETTDYFFRSDSGFGLCLFLPQQYVI